MRAHAALALAVVASVISFGAADARAAGWVRATVTVKPINPPANTPAPSPVDYYFNEQQRMAAVISSEGGDKSIQFMSANQGYMDTFSSKRNEIIHSELTKSAILPQDNALPTTLQKALEGAADFLGTEKPNDQVAQDRGAETHTLTAQANGPKVTLVADGASKNLLRIVQETPDAVTTIDFDYRSAQPNSIFDLGVQRNTKYVDNMPSPQARQLLDQLDARLEKDVGDGVAIIITDPQAVGAKNERYGHDKNQPYTVEVFGRNGASFVYRVHSVQQAPQGNVDQILASLQKEPATSYVVYDGKTLSQLTYDPQTGKPVTTERQVKLEAKDFAASNFPRRVYLGREALGTLIPVSKTEYMEDPARPGQKGLRVTRPTQLVYQDEKNQQQSAAATQLTIYWVDPNRGYAPVEYYERRDSAPQSRLKPEVLSTKFTDLAAMPDGGSLPTRWETGTWDIRGSASFNSFSLMASFNKRLDGAWFTKPATPPEQPSQPGQPPR